MEAAALTDSPRDELTGLLRRGILEDLNGEFVAREPSDVWSLMVIEDRKSVV